MIGKNSYQEFIIAGQLEASQFGVLHHRVEALRANGCVFQLKYFTSICHCLANVISTDVKPGGCERLGSAPGHFPSRHLSKEMCDIPLTFREGSRYCRIMQSQIGEHGEDGKLQPDDFKHSIYDTKHSICDSKHYICQPDGSKRPIYSIYRDV